MASTGGIAAVGRRALRRAALNVGGRWTGGRLVPSAGAPLGLGLGAAVVLAAVLAPLYLGEFEVGLVALGLVYGLFAFGLDLAWGRAGVISIGHAVFFGIGAYGAAIAGAGGGLPLVGGTIAIVLATATGAGLAAMGLRRATNPSTMAVLTLAITLLAEKIAIAWTPVTGGSNGIFVPAPGSTHLYYWICLAAEATVVAVVWATVLRRPFGNRLTAVRLNEQRAEHLGIPVYRTRVLGFTLSALVSAFAGALAAPWLTSVSPDQVSILLSTQVLVWVAVGGRATVLGPFIGAVAATYGQDALSDWLGHWYLLLLGVLFVLSVILFPGGIAGLFRFGPQVVDARVRRRRQEAAAAATAPDATEAVLAARAVVKRFAGNTVLDGVSLEIRPAEVVCLIGPNGAGKSTFLNVLSGALACDSGDVTLRGRRVEDLSPDRRIAAGLARTFQVPSLFPGLTVAEHLVMARQEAATAPPPLPRVYARLEEAEAATTVERLSLSDRRSLEIAMALCARPDVLLLDEPAAGLAHAESLKLAETLLALRAELGCAIICVEHDMEIVQHLADRVICLHHGRVLSAGTMDAVSADPEVRRAYLGMA